MDPGFGEDESASTQSALSSKSHHLLLIFRYGNNSKTEWQLTPSDTFLIELTHLALSLVGVISNFK